MGLDPSSFCRDDEEGAEMGNEYYNGQDKINKALCLPALG
jgi:hypothetical protein